MEAVGEDALVGEFARQAVELGQPRHGAVEGGVEAGHLRQVRHMFGDHVDRRQVVRLVQGRQRNQRPHGAERRSIDQDRTGEIAPAMDHPVSGGDDAKALVVDARASPSGGR